MRALVIFACLALAGCQSLAGKGPITFSNDIGTAYQRYLTEGEPLAFAATLDGRGGFYYYCEEVGCDANRAANMAIGQCELRNKGKECALFDIRGDIVWENPGEWWDTEAARQPASASRSRNEYLRALSVEWEGMDGPIAGWVDFAKGDVSLTLTDGLKCTGFERSSGSKGTWAIQCDNGLTATGTYEGRGKGKGSTGEGIDSEGRAIRFNVAGAS
jgi:hypothetical protein